MLARPALAQEVDYGGLEALFGAPVTTSATGSPQLASQAPADMQIITADDIRRSGASNIADILNFVAGIDVRQDGTLSDDVSIRGFSQSLNPRLLVLINGREVYVEDYGYVAWQALPVQLPEIRQIEIVRGPASALFGFNATSGVINIITYDPLHDDTNVASLGLGSDGTLEGSLITTAQVANQAGLRISLGGLRTNEYREDSQASTQGYTEPRPHEGNFNLDGRFVPRPGMVVSAEITDSSADSYNPSFYAPSIEIYRTRSYKLGFTDDTRYGLFSLKFYINRNDQNSNDFLVQHYNLANQVSVLQVNDLLRFADVHAVRIGFEYRDSRAWGSAYGGTASSKDYAANLMWSWQITPEISLTNAARIDHLVFSLVANPVPINPYTIADYNRATVTAASYNSGLVFQPTTQDRIRLLAGRGAQAPSLIEEDYQHESQAGPFDLLLAGSPDLKASTLDNYEVDYDRDLPAWQASASFALYYQIDRDFLLSPINIAPQFSDGSLAAISRNFGNATAFGGEFGIHGAQENGWRWDLSYALFTAHEHLSVPPSSIPFDFADATPTSEIDFGLGYGMGRLEADLQGKWQSQYADYNTNSEKAFYPVEVRNFTSLNARIGYMVTPALTLAVVGRELTAPRIDETAGLPVDRRVLFTATYGF
jgi:iron complex outermembrane receptor protein